MGAAAAVAPGQRVGCAESLSCSVAAGVGVGRPVGFGPVPPSDAGLWNDRRAPWPSERPRRTQRTDHMALEIVALDLEGDMADRSEDVSVGVTEQNREKGAIRCGLWNSA